MTIYILAPQNQTTGGPELAHQLCHAINRMTDIPAYMCYVDLKAPFEDALAIDCPAPKRYEIYKTTHVSDVSLLNREDAFVIAPEGLTLSLYCVPRSKKILWWMSVDNYISSTHESNLDYLRDNICLHLFQSYYSKDYVEKKFHGAKGIFLSDYINEAHGKFIYPANLRQNVALYNPQKGYDDLKPLIDYTPWLKWTPLLNLELEQMIFLVEAGKIYVDFGNHPGKDRIPREAASNGCVVITNKKGSAAYDQDVPIPSMYKFESPSDNLEKIDALLHDICDNFEIHQNNFASYRSFIKNEKARFDKDVLSFIEALSTC